MRITILVSYICIYLYIVLNTALCVCCVEHVFKSFSLQLWEREIEERNVTFCIGSYILHTVSSLYIFIYIFFCLEKENKKQRSRIKYTHMNVSDNVVLDISTVILCVCVCVCQSKKIFVCFVFHTWTSMPHQHTTKTTDSLTHTHIRYIIPIINICTF